MTIPAQTKTACMSLCLSCMLQQSVASFVCGTPFAAPAISELGYDVTLPSIAKCSHFVFCWRLRYVSWLQIGTCDRAFRATGCCFVALESVARERKNGKAGHAKRKATVSECRGLLLLYVGCRVSCGIVHGDPKMSTPCHCQATS